MTLSGLGRVPLCSTQTVSLRLDIKSGMTKAQQSDLKATYCLHGDIHKNTAYSKPQNERNQKVDVALISC